MLGLKLIHVSKSGPRRQAFILIYDGPACWRIYPSPGPKYVKICLNKLSETYSQPITEALSEAVSAWTVHLPDNIKASLGCEIIYQSTF